MISILRFDQKKKFIYLVQSSYCDRICFFMFLLQSCTRDNKKLLYWAITAATITCSKDAGLSQISIFKYYGITTTLLTLLLYTDKLQQIMMKKLSNVLKDEEYFIFCIDNN